VSLASIAEFIGALTTVLPQRALTVTLAGVPIGAGVFAIVGTDPTLHVRVQMAVGSEPPGRCAYGTPIFRERQLNRF